MNAPYFADHAIGPVPQTHWAVTSDGKRIRLATWPGGNRGTCILLNGRAEFVEKYAPVAKQLADLGFSSLSLDWRGQGLSTRDVADTGDVAEFTDYQRDLAAALAHPAATALPKGPRIILAHSMGGCIVLRALLEGLKADAVIFSAPMWGVRLAPSLSGLVGPVANATMALGMGSLRLPGTGDAPYTMTHPFSGNCLTSDAESYLGHRAQLTACPPLRVGGPSFRWIGLSLKECAVLRDKANPDLPILTLFGTDESVVDSVAIHARMAKPGNTHLTEIPAARHEVLFETPDLRKRAWSSITTFLDNALQT